MKNDRFQKRRALLRRRHKCTRCGTGTPKPDCRLCPDCLGVLAAKRAIKTDPDAQARKRDRLERSRALIRAALARTEARFLDVV